MPVKVQRWGGAFQVENISDPSVKQELFGWMAALELGPQSAWRFSNALDSRKLNVLKSSQLCASKRPGPARSGYLCFYPKMKVAVFVEDAEHRPNAEPRPPRTAVLRMRHSPAVYNTGGAIFAATLAISDSTLWLEDVLAMDGKNIWNDEPFSRRWQRLRNWFLQDWSEDMALQRGLAIKARELIPLEKFRSEPGDVWEFIPEDAQRRRLIWKDRRLNNVVLSSYPQKPKPQQQQQRYQQNKPSAPAPAPAEQQTTKVGILDTYFPALPTAGDGSLVAIAKKDLSGPDVYALSSADGKHLSIAVIRKMQISLEMRKYTEPVRVRVEWNSSFDRWEIIDVNVSSAASPASAFVVQ